MSGVSLYHPGRTQGGARGSEALLGIRVGHDETRKRVQGADWDGQIEATYSIRALPLCLDESHVLLQARVPASRNSSGETPEMGPEQSVATMAISEQMVV